MSSNVEATRSFASLLRDLGARLAQIRLSRNLTQADLARLAGVSARSVIRLEAGENASLDTFVRILTALQLADHLLSFLPNPTVRPVERALLAGRERQRARARATTPKATAWAWTEEGEE